MTPATLGRSRLAPGCRAARRRRAAGACDEWPCSRPEPGRPAPPPVPWVRRPRPCEATITAPTRPTSPASPASTASTAGTTPGAALVWARAAVLGGAMALVGGVSHTSAGGLLPQVAVTALVVLGCVALSAVFLTGPASPLRVVALLVGGQTGVHVALTLAAGHVGDAATTVPLRSGSPLTPASVDGRRVGSLMEQTTAPARTGRCGWSCGPSRCCGKAWRQRTGP